MASSLTQIARMAKVSAQTVSLAFRGSPKIPEVTRQRILEICHKCGYVPHADARSIRRRSFKRIACVVTCLSAPPNLSPYGYTSYLNTAVQKLAEQGYSIIFEPFHFDWLSYEFIEPPKLFTEIAVDGILGVDAAGIVPSHVDERLAGMGVPVVWVNRQPVPGIPCIPCDEVAGGRALVRHLFDLGHRRIGYVGAKYKSGHFSVRDRFRGVQDELRARGLDTSAMYAPDPEDARTGLTMDIVRRLLNHRPGVTAVIAYNRIIYDVLLHQMAERGLRIPDDLSVCYFASPRESSFLFPITAWEVPEYAMAQTGVEILLKLLTDRNAAVEVPEIAGRLHTGRTTGPPNGGRKE